MGHIVSAFVAGGIEDIYAAAGDLAGRLARRPARDHAQRQQGPGPPQYGGPQDLPPRRTGQRDLVVQPCKPHKDE